MSIKEILLFSHPKSVSPQSFSPGTIADVQGCNWRPFDGDEELEEICDRSGKLSLPLSHSSGCKCFQYLFRGRVRTWSDVWSMSGAHPQWYSSGNPLSLGSLCAWLTQHPLRRKPSYFSHMVWSQGDLALEEKPGKKSWLPRFPRALLLFSADETWSRYSFLLEDKLCSELF